LYSMLSKARCMRYLCLGCQYVLSTQAAPVRVCQIPGLSRSSRRRPYGTETTTTTRAAETRAQHGGKRVFVDSGPEGTDAETWEKNIRTERGEVEDGDHDPFGELDVLSREQSDGKRVSRRRKQSPIKWESNPHEAMNMLGRHGSETTRREAEPFSFNDDELFDGPKEEQSGDWLSVFSLDETIDQTTDRPKRPARPKEYKRASGERVIVDAENLGMSVLGKPAHAIIMHKTTRIPKRNPPKESKDHIKPVELDKEQLETLDRRVSISMEEASANIEELRPKDTSVLPFAEYRHIKRTLAEGFTEKQLRHYLTENTVTIRQQGDPLVVEPRYGWMEKQWKWQPIAMEDLETESHKERLAGQLMRESWQLSIQEMENGLGEQGIKIGFGLYRLLLRKSSLKPSHIGIPPCSNTPNSGNQMQWFPPLQQFVIDEDGSIHFSPKFRRLKFRCTKAKADAVLDKLNEVVQRAKAESFPIQLVKRESEPSEEIMEELGRLTGTFINLTDNNVTKNMRQVCCHLWLYLTNVKLTVTLAESPMA
jgi:hypothetical protein